MNQRICNRCKKRLESGETRLVLLRTKEIVSVGPILHKEMIAPETCHFICPECKTLFLDFMEGEAIPACKEKAAGS